MTGFLVLGGLVTVLAVACWWESRSGRPAWGAHLDHGGRGHGLTGSSTPASRGRRRSTGAAVALGALFGVEGGGDGG